jgi:uncharacterized protein (DUF1015 family)
LADVRPFPGVRFNLARAGEDLSNLVCPPFDVISPEQQAALYARDPHNAVRLELPMEEPGDATGKYRRAASEYAAWISEGVLVRDAEPALYLYECRFNHQGQSLRRRGLIAALRLEPWERRVVRPHERVLAGAIQDRIQLMRACHANFSPIWVLYRGLETQTEALWRIGEARPPEFHSVDRDGAEHAVWRCTDPAPLELFHGALLQQPVYIADGHHRYTTALQLRDELNPADPDSAANFVLAHLVQAEDPGLPVTGIHRLVRLDGETDGAALRTRLSDWFQLSAHDGDPAGLFAALQSGPRPPAFGIYAPKLGLCHLASLKADAVPRELRGDHSEAWARLDAAAMHTLGIDRALPAGTQGLLDAGRLTYAYSVSEVEAAVETGRASVALFLAGTPVEQVLEVADAQDRMPEKSTYFFPKPLTGMVIASLDEHVPRPAANL